MKTLLRTLMLAAGLAGATSAQAATLEYVEIRQENNRWGFDVLIANGSSPEEIAQLWLDGYLYLELPMWSDLQVRFQRFDLIYRDTPKRGDAYDGLYFGDHVLEVRYNFTSPTTYDSYSENYTITYVPDAGATAAMLGLGLVGLHIVRRRAHGHG